MRWRPPLVLRSGRHGVASPTSAVGHLFAVLVAAVIALVASASMVASTAEGPWMGLVLAAWLLLLGRSLWDAWAWLAATEAERAAFRFEVESQRPWTAPSGYAPIFDANRWRRATWALLFAAVAGWVALAGWHAELLVPAIFAVALLMGGGLELRRGREIRAASPAA